MKHTKRERRDLKQAQKDRALKRNKAAQADEALTKAFTAVTEVLNGSCPTAVVEDELLNAMRYSDMNGLYPYQIEMMKYRPSGDSRIIEVMVKVPTVVKHIDVNLKIEDINVQPEI